MSTAGAFLWLVTDKRQCVLATTGKIAVHFTFNGGYMLSRYPAKLDSIAIQIHRYCRFTHASPYKSGWSYNRSAASLALPALEIAWCSFPLVDPGLPAIDNLHGRPLVVPGWEIIHLGYRVILYTQRSGRADALVKRAENLERVRASRDQYPREFTRNDGHVLPRDPGEWLESPFQEHFCAGLVFLALRIAIGDRLDGHAIADLSPEGLEFRLDPLAILLQKSLIRQTLFEVRYGYESYGRFLRRSLAFVLGDHEAVLHPILPVGQIYDADPIGRV